MLKYTVVLVVLAIAVTGSFAYYSRNKNLAAQESEQVEKQQRDQPEQPQRRDWVRWREERRREMQTSKEQINDGQGEATRNKESKRQQEKWQQRKRNHQERRRGMENRVESEMQQSRKRSKESQEDVTKGNQKSGRGFQQDQRRTNRGRQDQDRDYLVREWITIKRDRKEDLRGSNKSSESDTAEHHKGNEAKASTTVRPYVEYSYGVYDPATGDHKDQWEKRVGDHVKGVYSLDQPDGKKRIVYYEGGGKQGVETNVLEIENTNNHRYQKEKEGVAHSYNVLTRFD